MKRSSKLLNFPGQITIYEYLERISSEKSGESYLEKGERLTTLARKRFERMMDKLKFTDLEKTIFSTKIPEHLYLGDIVGLLAKTVVRPLIKAMTTFDDGDKAYLSLKEVIDFDFTLNSAKGLDYVHAFRYMKFRHKKTDDQLVLTIREDGWPDVVVYGYRAYGLPKGKYGSRNDLIFPDKSIATDIALILSWLVCLTLYNRAVSDENMENDIESAFLCEKYENSDLVKFVNKKSGIKAGWINGLDATIPAYTSFQKYKTPKDSVLFEFTRVTGVPVSGRSTWPDDILPMINKQEIATGLRPRGYLVLPDVEWYLVMRDPVGSFKSGLGRASYNVLLSRCKENLSDEDTIPLAWAKPKVGSYFEKIATNVLRALWEKKGSVAKVFKYYDDIRNECKRARVWQTKKNIPQKMLKDMEESTLNKHFGYVEFDESCDADALKKIADEFESFKERRLPDLDLSSVSIRFRLLGNYKAAGLYIPNINCLCVDVRHPSSFIHELGHAIDYLMGGISEKNKFYRAYNAYKSALVSRKNMPYEQYKTLAESKSKYNLDYYLLETEVFARCMEMYVTRVLKEELAICKIEAEMNWAYPESDAMMELIKEYFDYLFSSLNTTGDDIIAA